MISRRFCIYYITVRSTTAGKMLAGVTHILFLRVLFKTVYKQIEMYMVHWST